MKRRADFRSLFGVGLLALDKDSDADAFLIAAIRSGDQRAWKQLIDRYSGRLLAFARTRLRGVGEAEDALQETFLGFLTSLPHYDPERSLETYLFAIVRYKIGEALEKKRRGGAPAPGFDADESSRPLEPAVSETPSQSVIHRERVARQEQVIATLLRGLIESFRDRGKLEDLQVIELLFYVGLRNKEAADRLGRDEKSIAGVKFRALGALREMLDQLEAEDRGLLDEVVSSDATIARVWRERRLSCLKRSTIGSFLLGVLDEPWQSYTAFHLDGVKCEMCIANRDDLAAEAAEASDTAVPERMFQSSVGFLSAGPR